MILIPLTRGQVATIDDEDVHLSRKRWRALWRNGRGWYAMRNEGSKVVYLHHAVLGPVATAEIDHVNGNGLDCRRANLRPATNSQNQANRRAPRNNTSGFRGVSWHKSEGKWRAVIKVHQRQTQLGYFGAPEDAARAYDAAARRAFGEFARVNFPGPSERSAREPALAAGGRP